MNKGDYRDTLQLPKTEFPMRANLPKREPEMLQHWQENNFYEQLQQEGKEQQLSEFILHDGPPYANGDIHIGTAMNKILKDFVIRSRSMDGYRVPYVPGWDTHGLPIELRAIKDFGVDRSKVSSLELRKKCREYALKYVGIQRDEFIRLGIWGDWEDPYLTLAPEYEARQIEIFGKMASNGFIYKALKPVYWCSDCETALAEAEIEYDDHTSPSIYVKFAVKDGKDKLSQDASFVIWTTTPWTIPANLAITVNPFLAYVLVDTEQGKLIVAKGLLEQFATAAGLEKYDIIEEFIGSDLEGITCQHPLVDRESLVILGEHATLEAGTGCVHTAPGHGQDDYIVGLKYNLPVFAPVNEHGVFTQEAGKYAGMHVMKANSVITQDLDEVGALVKSEDVEHSYPHCWRCKYPIIFRGTEQWFASLDGFRQNMLDAIKDVEWIPSWGIDRITNMVADRGDWCISRQRTWGVPIPLFYCDDCNEAVITDETIMSVADIFRTESSDAWWKYEADQLLPEGFVCPKCGGKHFTKETDIMDVWFDSGVSHSAVLQQRDDLSWPADLYLEGSDQHRGWFQSSLSTSIAALGQAPYKSVLTHGFVVDGEGKKMSKSLGNFIEPKTIIDQYGADVLRMWVASAEYRSDIRVSQDILKQLSDAYRRIRNTARFILGNLEDFEPTTDSVNYDQMSEIDQWALLQTAKLSERVRSAYNKYEFHTVYHSIHQFCSVDLSGFYLDVLKDRLYCDGKTSITRRSTQTAMYAILVELVKLLAPIIPFTADEIWQHLPESQTVAKSVHLTRWDSLPAAYRNEQLAEKWDSMLEVRHVVSKALEEARNDKKLGSSNDARIVISADEQTLTQLQSFTNDDLAMLFIVSEVELQEAQTLEVTVKLAESEKCERCWRHSDSVDTAKGQPICARCHSVVTNSSAE